MTLVQDGPYYESANEDEPDVVGVPPAWIAEGVRIEVGFSEDGLYVI